LGLTFSLGRLAFAFVVVVFFAPALVVVFFTLACTAL
jgi:hypothetical protein